jgi:glyoxylase-like metal-dependent hydrolase (beta-lactamase superfamily II)
MTRARVTLAILLTITAAAAPIAQPQIDPAAVRSYERARVVLDAAVAAMYGPSGIDGLQNVAFRYEGDLIHRNQSARTEPPYDRTPTKGYVIFDRAGARLRIDDAGSFPGGFAWDNRFLLVGRDAANIDLLRKRSSTSTSATPAPLDPRLRRLPHAYLAAALDRARSLRFAGTRDIGGKPHDDITYASPDGRTINLIIDQKARTLTRAEWVAADPTAGDTIAADLFPEYQPAGSLLMPLRRIAETAGEATLDVRHSEFTVNQADAVLAAAFERPSGFEPLSTDSTAERVTLLAPHVRMIRAASGYNTLLVELADHAVLVEAPSNDDVSGEVLRTAREALPGKPVRFVAATHHHDDHAGGARFYMAQGLTFVTTPGNVAYFEHMARRRSTLFGDRPIDKPRIETISGRRSFSDGQTTVELIDIGRGPHANEMLIAYVPQAKIVFQGDLLNRPADGRVQAGNATTVHFARRLRELGIDFERVAGVHGPPASREEFERIVQMTDKSSF